MIPNRIPSEMELVMTMAKRVMKQGSPSSYELKSMWATRVNINKPTRMRTGLVAADGMERKSGAKKREMVKKKAMEAAVSPVRPPSLTPDADST